MNWDRLQGSWKEYKGKVREQWGKLTDNDLDIIDGKREQLVGRIQHHYGVAKDIAERQTEEFLKGFNEADARLHDKSRAIR